MSILPLLELPKRPAENPHPRSYRREAIQMWLLFVCINLSGKSKSPSRTTSQGRNRQTRAQCRYQRTKRSWRRLSHWRGENPGFKFIHTNSNDTTSQHLQFGQFCIKSAHSSIYSATRNPGHGWSYAVWVWSNEPKFTCRFAQAKNAWELWTDASFST